MALPHWENDPSRLSYVQHRRSDIPVQAVPYLLDAVQSTRALPIAQDTVQRFFPDSIHFQPQPASLEQLSRYTPAELITVFGPMLEELYTLAQASLDKSVAYKSLGFNDHTYKGHILGVTEAGLTHLQAAQASDHHKNVFTLGSLSHDTGNVFSRDRHAELSYDVLRRYLPNIADDPEIGAELRQTIYYHREETGWQAIQTLISRSENAEDFYKNLQEEVGIPALALNIADSSDIGPHRANLYQADSGIVNDPFQAVELLTRKKVTAYDSLTQTFHFHFSFSPTPNQQIEELGYLTLRSKHQRDGRNKTLVPADMHRAFRERGELYGATWLQKFRTIHGLRELVTAAFSFALFPEQQRFVCRIEDEEVLPLHMSGKYTSPLPYERCFTRESLFQFLKSHIESETR